MSAVDALITAVEVQTEILKGLKNEVFDLKRRVEELEGEDNG